MKLIRQARACRQRTHAAAGRTADEWEVSIRHAFWSSSLTSSEPSELCALALIGVEQLVIYEIHGTSAQKARTLSIKQSSEIFETITDDPGYTTVIHCTKG